MFHPAVAKWFEEKFGTPTEPQALGWPRIQAGEDTLIAAPTGSGKTLAAFLACLDSMIREGAALRDEMQVLYVSPLKALANDVRKNLLEPLAELRAFPEVPEIRAAVRTGDTPQSERQAMLRQPPHVVVTTPESFYLLLTSTGGRKMLSTVRTVVVDEIHAVARDKRGAHLMLSLERLDALCGRRCVRVGLSATQRPIEEIGRFLTGGRPCAIVESGSRRAPDVLVEVPRDELSAVASKEQREEMHALFVQGLAEAQARTVVIRPAPRGPSCSGSAGPRCRQRVSPSVPGQRPGASASLCSTAQSAACVREARPSLPRSGRRRESQFEITASRRPFARSDASVARTSGKTAHVDGSENAACSAAVASSAVRRPRGGGPRRRRGGRESRGRRKP